MLGQTRFFVALRDPKLRDPLSDVVSVIIALNAGARWLRSLLNYRLRSANNVPLSTLVPLSLSPPHTRAPRRSSFLGRRRDRGPGFGRLPLSFSFLLCLPLSPFPPPHCLALSAPCSRRRDTHHGVVYLLLASPLNGISVLSDGPRAELRPCASLARFLLPSLLIPESSLREYIARAASADARSPLLPSHSLSLSLPLCRSRDRDYNALRSRYCYQCNGAAHDFSGSKF